MLLLLYGIYCTNTCKWSATLTLLLFQYERSVCALTLPKLYLHFLRK